MCAIIHEHAHNMNVSLLRCNHQRSQTFLNQEIMVCNSGIIILPTLAHANWNLTISWWFTSVFLLRRSSTILSSPCQLAIHNAVLPFCKYNLHFILLRCCIWNLQLNSNFTHSCTSKKVLFTTHCKNLTIPEFVDLVVHHYQWACSQCGHAFFDMQLSGESNHSKEEGYNYSITILLIPCNSISVYYINTH